MHLRDDAGILAEVRKMNGTASTLLGEADAWAGHTTGSFERHVFSGGHFFLTDHADEIIKILDKHFRAERARVMA